MPCSWRWKRIITVELHEALSQISDIRQQMAKSQIFRGYRSASVAITGFLAIATACLQPVLVPVPSEQPQQYLALWISVAVIAVTMAGIQFIRRAQHAQPGVSRELTRLAIEQFMPCIVIGALMTVCLYAGPRDALWVLPGLWGLFFAMGILSSCRLLPPQTFYAGLYYLVCGCCCLLLGHDDQAFAAWQMGVTFGGGHLLTAAILYWTLERCHDESTRQAS